MITKNHDKPGYFPTPPGTCIIKPDFPLGDGSKSSGKNWHPFVVVTDGDDYVECLMGRTLYDARSGKDRTWKLDKIEGAMEITDPCPPMDYPNRRRQYVDASQVMIVPKAILYESTNLELCNFKGNRLSQEQTKTLQEAVKEHANDRFATYCDPYDYKNTDYSIDKYLPKHRQVPSSFENIEQQANKSASGPDFTS